MTAARLALVLLALPSIAAAQEPAPLLHQLEWTEQGCSWAMVDASTGERRTYRETPECPHLLVWDATGQATYYVEDDALMAAPWSADEPRRAADLPPQATGFAHDLWLAAETARLRLAATLPPDGAPVRLESGQWGVRFAGEIVPLPDGAGADSYPGLLLVYELDGDRWHELTRQIDFDYATDAAVRTALLPWRTERPGSHSLLGLSRDAATLVERFPAERAELDEVTRDEMYYSYYEGMMWLLPIEHLDWNYQPPLLIPVGDDGTLLIGSGGWGLESTPMLPAWFGRRGGDPTEALLDTSWLEPFDGPPEVAVHRHGTLVLLQALTRPVAAVYRHPDPTPILTLEGDGYLWLPVPELWDLAGRQANVRPGPARP